MGLLKYNFVVVGRGREDDFDNGKRKEGRSNFPPFFSFFFLSQCFLPSSKIKPSVVQATLDLNICIIFNSSFLPPPEC